MSENSSKLTWGQSVTEFELFGARAPVERSRSGSLLLVHVFQIRERA